MQEHARRVVDALRAWDGGRVSPNFAAPHEEESARRAYAPTTLSRLAEITAAYDPHGVMQAASFTRA